MKRWILTLAVFSLILAGPAFGLDPRLAAINDWLYVLQPSGAASITAITASSFDGVVMDYSADGGASGEFTAAEIAALRNSGKLVLAYLSIGEAEDYRWYWDPAWNDEPPPDPDAPSWLGPFNPLFPNNYKVRYWQPAWQATLFGTPSGANKSSLDRILDQGFDGIYLDIVDAFTYWSEENVERTRLQARTDMAALVAALGNYARLTRGRPNFLVFPQNGEDIILNDVGSLDALGQNYLESIDGVGVEDVFYDELAAQPPGDVTFRTGVLALYLSSAGDTNKVISVDYVWDAANPTGTANINRYNNYHSQCQAAGYTAYAAHSDRALDQILAVNASGGFTFAQPQSGGLVVFADGFESGTTAAWTQTVP